MEFNAYNAFVFWLPWGLGIITAIAVTVVAADKWTNKR